MILFRVKLRQLFFLIPNPGVERAEVFDGPEDFGGVCCEVRVFRKVCHSAVENVFPPELVGSVAYAFCEGALRETKPGGLEKGRTQTSEDIEVAREAVMNRERRKPTCTA